MSDELFAGENLFWGFSAAGKGGIATGWQLKVKDGKPIYSTVEDEGVQVFEMKSYNSSFSVQRKIHVNIGEHPYISWRWKAIELPEGGDFRKSGKDDQAAQVFVAFPGRKSISYIWDTTAPVGSVGAFSIPLVIEVKIIVVTSGGADIGKWVTVTRNVYEDYKRLYGEEPPPAEGIRFQINSQHTKTAACARLAWLQFKKAP
ncbi:MAG: DUF3047 domain-containing protein [Nitrospirota bacterium]